MGVANTARTFKRGARARCIARVSPGRLYETCALAYCRRRGYRLFAKNLRFSGGELDLVAVGKQGQLVVLEVRGKATPAFLPRWTLSFEKKARVQRLAFQLGRRYRRRVRVEFVEVLGRTPKTIVGSWIYWLGVRWFPEAFGFRIRAWTLR